MIKNISSSLLRQVISAILSLITVILLARLLGPDGMGRYAVAVLIPQFIVSVLNLGLPSSLVFFIASKEYEAVFALRQTQRFLQYYIPGILLVVGIIIFLFSESIFPELNSYTITFAFLAIPFILMQGILLAFLQALEEFKLYNLLILLQPLFFLVGIGLLNLFNILNPEVILLLFLVTHLLGWYLSNFQIDKIIKTQFSDVLSYNPLLFRIFIRKNLKYGVKVYLSNITAMLNYRADLYLVGLLANVSSAGIYAIALQISERLFIISKSISMVLLPRLSSLQGNSDKQELITNVVAKWSLIITSLAGLMLYLITKSVLVPLFGENYQESLEPLMVLIIAASFSAYSRVLSNSIAAKNQPEWNLYIGVVTSIVNITLNIIFIPKYGLMGGAWATFTSFLINFFLKTIIYIRISGSNLAMLVDFSYEIKLYRKRRLLIR